MPDLCVLRHGIPEAGADDPPLSAEGARRIQQAAAGMARLGLVFDVILSSPLRRAEQTARLVAESVGSPSRFEVTQRLAPGCSLQALGEMFQVHVEATTILLVGHQPDMGKIAADLIGARAPLPLDRGGLCWLDLTRWPQGRASTEPTAALRMLLPGGLLARLA